MKTKPTAYSSFTKAILWTLVGISLAIAVLIYYLATTGDTTALGDPYYEDQILAPARAFGPWALSLFGSGLALMLTIIMWWHERQR